MQTAGTDAIRKSIGVQFCSRNAGDNGAVYGGYPDQFDAFTQIGDVLAVAGFQFHDIDHFPISILAGVEGLTLETVVGLLLDTQTNTDTALLEGAQLFPVYRSLSSKLCVQSKATIPVMSAASIAPRAAPKSTVGLASVELRKAKAPNGEGNGIPADGLQVQQPGVIGLMGIEQTLIRSNT